ncbi:hypothetical protein ACIBKZ_15615 [Streptomyces sp. NPDC050421]|uniref:hypothetical protein n=1 Tax=Streptomyces sp. NPDC050421 TaxID=3365613 RepID=UPI0037BD7589
MSTPVEYDLPASIPTVRVTGEYRGWDGRGLAGTVTFTGPGLVTFPEADLFIGGPVVCKLDEFGKFAVELPATDSPNMNPSDWAYTVKENLSGVVGSRTFALLLPAATPVVDLADVTPMDPTTPNYVPVRGSNILTGAVAPTSEVGLENDYFVQYDVRTLLGLQHTTITNWLKTEGVWKRVGGELHGSQIFTATGSTPSVDAKPGDILLRTDTGDMWQRGASSWGAPIGNIRGPQGPKGDTGLAGSQIYTFPDATGIDAAGVVGDFALRTDTGRVYIKTSGGWSLRGDLKGPIGPQGPQGPTGPAGQNGTGTGTVTAVNSVAPDGAGNVALTADDVGAIAKTGGSIQPASGNGLTVYGATNGASPTNYFRVTADGHAYSNSLRNTFYNLGIGDTSVDFGGGNRALGIQNAGTTPTGTPTNGVVAYAESGKLKVRQSDGATVTVGDGVSTVNTKTGAVTLNAADVGALATSTRGASNGVASLGANGYVPASQIDEAIAIKSADTSRVSTATAANDNHLTVPVAANATYAVETVIVWTTGGGGMRVDFGAPSGSSMVWTDNDGSGSSTLGTDLTFNATTGTSLKGALKTGSSAGTLALRWAQNASHATATVLKSGCYLSARRIA